MSLSDDRRALWSGLLAEQKVSGLSVAAFCLERRLSVNTFFNWRKRLRNSVPAGWVAMTAEQPSPATALTLHIGSVSVDVASGFDRQLLLEVLQVLEARC